MAATRLRKTFQYPDSSDDEDTVEAGMDAQDQAHLLSTLRTHDTSSTRTYTLLLLLLPMSIALFTTPLLFSTSTLIPSLLAIASQLASAYILYYLPLPPAQPTIIVDGQEVGRRKKAFGINARAERKEVLWLSDEVQDLVARYLVPVTGTACAALAVVELMQGREWREGMTIGGGYLPGLVLTVVLWARRELRIVDLGELQQMATRSL